MTDYADDINTFEYKYVKPVYYTNTDNYSKQDFILKLYLSESNFNFELPNEDGSDFRLLYSGSTLKMWKAYWSKATRKAMLFFKLPILPANRQITLFAYWGNEDATDISTPDDLGFFFAETFEETPLDSAKWDGYTSLSLTSYGYYVGSDSQPFYTISDPLVGQHNFRVEFGLYPLWVTEPTDNYYGLALFFQGDENDFYVGLCGNGYSVSNAVQPGGGTDTGNTGNYYGLENESYNDVTIEYNEDLDRVVVKLRNRDTYPDAEYYWSRKVEGDTRPTNVRFEGYRQVGNDEGPNPIYISWLALRPADTEELGLLDGSSLFIEYEYVSHQEIDVREYGPDITSIAYRHESSFGGDPYRLSDNGVDSDTNVWISDDDAIAEDYVALTISTAWADDITDLKYTHYDSGHVYHYNASKLSDDDEFINGWTYLNMTTTSGWAAIKFTSPKCIGAFRVKATSNLNACPKDYVFYGSHYHPVIDYSKKQVLAQGTFQQTEDWQFNVLLHDSKFRYYILEVQNTYANEDIEIQEWEMMESFGQRDRRYITQLRLHPALHGDLEYNFPKQISLEATNDGYTWDTLIPWTNTYTPFISHYIDYGQWQHYSFSNTSGYWVFRLLCKGHWLASDGRMAIGEWEMRELDYEEYTYHILSGSSNNIEQIWAQDGCGIDDAHKIFFAANDYLSRVADNRLVGSDALPEDYNDFNVIQEAY